MTDAPVALVTGASRGIGKASARSRSRPRGSTSPSRPGPSTKATRRSEPNSVRGDDPVVALPGSLESTAAEIAARGQRALIVPMDLLDLASVEAAPATVLREWGRIDVLFNNAIYQGRGTMDRILDMRMDDIDNAMRGNFAHQLRLIQLVVPHMIERGQWPHHQHGVGFGPSRSAGSRGCGRLGHRLRRIESRVRSASRAGSRPSSPDRGVRAFNVDPGNVITEKRRLQHPDDDFESGFGSAPGRSHRRQSSPGSRAATKRSASRASGSTRRSSAPTAACCPAGRPRASRHDSSQGDAGSAMRPKRSTRRATSSSRAIETFPSCHAQQSSLSAPICAYAMNRRSSSDAVSASWSIGQQRRDAGFDDPRAERAERTRLRLGDQHAGQASVVEQRGDERIQSRRTPTRRRRRAGRVRPARP